MGLKSEVLRKVTPFVLLIVGIALALLWTPSHPVDAWGLINPSKILQLILFLSVIQVLSAIVMGLFDKKFGGIALGFVVGLISSTALALSLSRQSHQATEDETRLMSLSYLSALLGMALEAFLLVLLGVGSMPWELLYIFAAPTLMTLFLIVRRTKTLNHVQFDDEPIAVLSVKSIVKLSLFISVILILSKALQKVLGHFGLYLLTFVVCLFELHGAIIANAQLYDSNAISVTDLGNLIAIGLLSSYLAKLVLISFLGSEGLRKRVIKYSLQMISSLLVGWALFLGI